LAGGQIVAGTGTVDPLGGVGPIGGIRQKLVGAKRAGASYFLAPAANCGEVAGHEPKGVEVLRVETVSGALAALTAIRSGDVSALARCE
jgi:PDZ domain-containing protein